MTVRNPTQYDNKLLGIQQALTLIKDKLLIVTICNEIAFQWVPGILNHLDQLTQENQLLETENDQLSLQNDSLIKQNIALAHRLKQS